MTGIHEVGSYPEEVEGDLAELIGEINSVGPKDPLKAGAYLHARFENIHPFADGNGRVGRTLLNYWLMINDYPPMIIYEEDKRHTLTRSSSMMNRSLWMLWAVSWKRRRSRPGRAS